MIDYRSEATLEPDVLPPSNDRLATPKVVDASGAHGEVRESPLLLTEAPAFASIEKAIAQCERQVRLQADRLLRQIEAGNDPTHSQTLLAMYQSSLVALERSRGALQRQHIFRSSFRAR